MEPAALDPAPAVRPRPSGSDPRPRVRGKFLFVGEEKLYVRGVTYGTFRPREDGHEFPEPEVVERDFALMALNGLNALRTYTVPPRWLLDAAWRHGLRVMVGLAAERFVGYLADRNGSADVEALVRSGVRACSGHPAVLCYAVGNEVPAPLARWIGRRRMERWVEGLYRAAKAEAPDSLVTYANYPTTEYLELPFLDLVCFNTYLETPDRLEAYLARLQNLAGDRPLLLGEMGLDSLRHGEARQARVLAWQVRAAFAAGSAGTFVYGWTDEWHRAGADVDDWAFGLTRRDRRPKAALPAVARAYAEAPIRQRLSWPRISVIVCTYNGARTLRECLEGLLRLDYPDFEVIVVNDGSSDATPEIAAEYGFRVITTRNLGLSSARNTGLDAATGEIVAYLDDDATPDPHWLTYLATSFMTAPHAAVGGPNIAPPGDGLLAEAVDHAPGNPTHVLLSDREAEHLPGCNMAFRKSHLQAIGGFDHRFRVAGDDVDVCWRLRERGLTLGFSPAAVVWHRRRGSLRGYWRQQWGYGRAEALLERKWPEKYNSLGHVNWLGRLYGKGLSQLLARPSRIYYGTWGSAPFQPLVPVASRGLLSQLVIPEWYLIVATLGALCALGTMWPRLLFTLPLLAIAAGVPVAQAAAAAMRASSPSLCGETTGRRWAVRGLTGLLHLLQPLARLLGRLEQGLTPWRRRGWTGLALPRPRRLRVWTERWQAPEERLRRLETTLKAAGAVVLRGGECDRWDLEVRGGPLGSQRLLMAVEEHGQGRQLVRVWSWPVVRRAGVFLPVVLGALAAGAALDGAPAAGWSLGAAMALVVVADILDCATSAHAFLRALERPGSGEA